MDHFSTQMDALSDEPQAGVHADVDDAGSLT